MKIAFGILSANEPAAAVTQLVRALGDDDPVFVHHDFSRQPAFTLPCPQAYLIRDFLETGWGTPGFVRAVFHLIRTALARSSFDYFQLLSGSCLPTRPTADLRRQLSRHGEAIHADLIDLDSDPEAMMSHGHRLFCRTARPAARLLRRSRRWYLGANPSTIQRANLGIERPQVSNRLAPLQRFGRRVHQAARNGALDRHPFQHHFQPFVGCLWFCLRRDVCEYLVRQEEVSHALPYLLGLSLCDEIVFPTLLGNSGFTIVGSNHLVNEFAGPHPRPFEECDIATLAGSDRHFARKFRTDVNDPVRRAVLQSLNGQRTTPGDCRFDVEGVAIARQWGNPERTIDGHAAVLHL